MIPQHDGGLHPPAPEASAGKAPAVPELPVDPQQAVPATPPGHVPDGRYGTPRKPLNPVVLRVLVAAGAVVVLAFVAWMAFGQEDGAVRGQDVGYSVKSAEVVEITFNVAKPRDATVVCTLQALSASFAQVGTREVTIGPTTLAETRYTTEIATSEEAVTAIVEDCRTLG
ncbi:DUF4307 domain-containing protein [Sanguibacter antarcticus]|uniref:Uncharacterized protein DUF4307 n=1 Tax=Sanguibacter antarcticus TaxID=372484 RepID=A0A2A9E097_9MICO|nr:DUF4307 domain-containing protein [Sanguibacter antarcticus]PFG32467.1 uncharacterized protein DUF4307 [Sanguibacter antarcticus]